MPAIHFPRAIEFDAPFDGPPPPPPSQEYLDESNVSSLLAVTGTFAFAALIATLMRLYVRKFMLHFIGADDCMMIMATLMALGTFACFVGESYLGMGRHWQWQQPWMGKIYFQYLFAHAILVTLGAIFVKISIALFLMRIVVQRSWRIFLWASIVFLICFAIACMGTLIFQCIPVNATWDFAVRMDPNTRCYSLKTFGDIGLFNSIVNIITDFVFALVPIPIIVSLQINLRQKISLVFVLSLGWLACVAGIWKAVEQVKMATNPDSSFKNRFAVLYLLELCLGILAASLPTLKPLFAAVLESTRSRFGSSRDTASGIAPSAVPIGFQRNSHIRLPDRNDQVELSDYDIKSNTSARTTVAESEPSPDADTSSIHTTRSARRTIHRPDAEVIREQWEAFRPIRNSSQERLHPVPSIPKEVRVGR